jgi:hypothetical protein
MPTRPLTIVLLTAAAGLGLLACADGPTGSAEVALGVEFALAPGEAALAGDDGLSVSFESVTEDSRCRWTSICIRRGASSWRQRRPRARRGRSR